MEELANLMKFRSVEIEYLRARAGAKPRILLVQNGKDRADAHLVDALKSLALGNSAFYKLIDAATKPCVLRLAIPRSPSERFDLPCLVHSANNENTETGLQVTR